MATDPTPASNKGEDEMTEIDKRTTGLYHKYDIQRTDGTDAPGGKHDGCDYFVLDLSHDPHAIPAMRAYAKSCAEEYPVLSAEIIKRLPPHA